MTHNHDETAETIRIGRNLAVTGAVFIALLAASFLPPLVALNQSLIDYVRLIWWAVLLGLVLGGLMDYFVPEAFVFRFLGSGRLRSIPYAVVAGFLMSACSHGILALAIQLYKKGAGTPAVIAFLLASPWANLAMTILLFSFFGPSAFLFIGAAMLVALISGVAYVGLERAGWIESQSPEAADEEPDWSRLRQFEPRRALRGVLAGTVSLANMVLWWILIGVMAASMIRAFVPNHLFMDYLGPDLPGLLVTLLFATVIEVCSEGTSPLAFEIYDQVGALGNPFVFLMAGVATDYTEIGLIWTNIGRRAAIWLPLVTVPQVVLIGALLNTLFG